MINWFDMPAEGLSNGGQFEVKELEVTENGTYEEKGEMYNKVVVNVEGGGGSSDFSTAEVTVNGKPTFFVAEVASLTENGLQGTCRKSPSENSFTVVLYQGSTIMQGVKGITPSFSIPADETNIILDESNGWYVITGDCTITIS